MMKQHIIKTRNKRGITQKQLAKLFRVSRQAIVAIEKGGFNPSLSLALKLSREFESEVGDPAPC